MSCPNATFIRYVLPRYVQSSGVHTYNVGTEVYLPCSSGDAPIWPSYCDGGTGLFTNIPSTFITVWVPALLVTIWQGSILPLLVYLLVQVRGRFWCG